jgi:two-component system, OmpR family, sensor histidine kinase PhoQ
VKRSIIMSSVVGSSLIVILITSTLSILGRSFIVDRIDAATKPQLKQLAAIVSNGLSNADDSWRLNLSQDSQVNTWSNIPPVILGTPRAGLWVSGDGFTQLTARLGELGTEPFQKGSSLFAALLSDEGEMVWQSGSFEDEKNVGAEKRISPTTVATANCEVEKGTACVLVPFNKYSSGDAYQIFVGQIDGSLQLETHRILNRFYLSLCFLALLLLIMQALVLVYAYRPLKLLSKTVTEIKSGTKAKIGGPTPSELQPLVDSFNQLLTAEADRRNTLRSALERLAHVLRTPLTVLQSRSYSDLDDQSTVREQTNRMLNIVDHELKKVSVSQVGSVGTRRILAIEPVVARIVNAYSGLPRLDVSKAQLDFNLEVLPPDLSFFGEDHDLEDAFGTVLENALRYARQLVTVCARPAKDSDQDAWIELSVADDGVGFQAGFIEQFSADYPLKGSSSDSYGLGLSIVSDITRKYGGTVTLKNLSDGGAQVVLLLPRGKV